MPLSATSPSPAPASGLNRRRPGQNARAPQPKKNMTTAYDFSFAKLGEPGEIKLEDFAGKAILIVNVASACGFTSQYRDLEALYEGKKHKLAVIGVPCNDFGAQEPGADEEIRNFCDSSYHVTFPMTAKVEIISPERRHPFYNWIAQELGESALPRWNFHKYLIDKHGALVEAFPSKAAPLGPQMLEAIKSAVTAEA
jgi:glutathione peroxidase